MKTVKEVVSEWKRESDIRECVAVHRSGDTLFIVTERPGFLIGQYGKVYNKYLEILKENGIKRVEFIDTFCGDVKEF